MHKNTPANPGVLIMTIAAAGLALSAYISPAHSAETAQAVVGAVNLEIMTRCDKGNTTFNVRNVGINWPKSSTFAIYRISGANKQLISQRRMRLNDGQKASFRIKKSRNLTGRLGIWVKPNWYSRKFAFDAKVVCR